MKSAFSILLSIVLLCAGLPITATAQTTNTVLPFSFCDTAADWVNGSYPSVSLGADNKICTEQPASLRITGDMTKGKTMVVYTLPKTTYDITPYTHFEFDLYTTDREALASGSGQLEFSSSGKCDIAELTFGMDVVIKQITKNGWNHITIPLNRGQKTSTDASQSFDAKAVNFFRFYLVNLSYHKPSYTLWVDNMYFSDGITKPNTDINQSRYKPSAPCQSNGYTYGDVTGNTAIDSIDALAILQYAVDKRELTNYQLAMADVDNNGQVTAVDALDILQYAVRKIAVFPKAALVTLPQAVEVGINESHLVHTQYPAKQAVVAVTDVIYWGAQGDGVTDDTVAFQKAIAYAESLEGGTVFVPSGKFVIRGNLTIPNGVTLQGDAPTVAVDQPAEGTVLMAYAGRNDEGSTPFITMDSSSALANLSVWYPEQTMDNITPYPWTIRQSGQYGINITNVRLVNSYKGICMGPNVNALQNIRGVVGTALKQGLILDYNVDICRIENVIFSPECWIRSGLSQTDGSEVMKQYLYENATAFKFEMVDWTYVTDITAHGYHVALGNSHPTMREDNGSPNGHVYNVDFQNCYIGYDAEYVNPIGMMITEGIIQAEIPVQTSPRFTTSASFNHLQIESTGDTAVLLNGSGIVTLENCIVKTQNGTGIQVNNGKLSATQVTFENCKTHIAAGDAADAIITTNCMQRGKLLIADPQQIARAVWDASLTVAKYSTAFDYNAEAVARPAGDAFVDITKAPYNADLTNTSDIGPAIQTALNDVAVKGGGIVYIPSGRYRLDSAVTIPTGVELRGSCTFPQHSHAYSTTLYTTYGKNGDADTKALITLSAAAGMAGFKVYYDRQAGGVNDCDSYAFSARGTGINNYILNVNFINSFYQVDFNTNRCDGHYINGVTGYPLEQGIVVGGGSVNGIVRDCQFNVHYFSDNPYYRTLLVDSDSFRQYATDHSEAFIVNHTKNQIMYHNFVLGVHSGIAVDSGADVFVLAHGTDGGDRSMTIRGTPSGTIMFVNTQLVVIGPGSTMAYVNIEPSFTGRVDMTQTNIWGQPTNCSILVGGGTLYYSQGTNIRSGNYGAKVWNDANLYMDTVNHVRSDLLYDLYLDESGKAITYGNFYGSGGLLYDPENRYAGTEF